MNLKRQLVASLAFVSAFLIAVTSCEKTPEPLPDRFEVSLQVPQSVDVDKDERLLELDILDAEAPEMTDVILFQNEQGAYTTGQIVEITSTSVSILLPAGFKAGKYMLYVKRGERKIHVSSTWIQINFITRIDFQPDPTTTI